MENKLDLDYEQVNRIVQDGNLESAFSKLIPLVMEWNKPFLKRYQMEITNPDVEAIIQDGFFKAFDTYEISRGDFRPYVCKVIQNLFRDDYRRKNSKKEKKFHSISLKDEIGIDDSKPVMSEEERHAMQVKLGKIMPLLSSKERLIIERILEGNKPRHVAEELGIERKSVYNAICRFKIKSKTVL